MRISPIISHPSFKGIKVTLSRQDASEQNPRAKQKAILEKYKQEADMTSHDINIYERQSQSKLNLLRSISFFNRSNPELKKSTQETAVILGASSSHASTLIGRQTSALKKAIADIREIDKKEGAKVESENRTKAANKPGKNVGFSKIVGYDHEKEVLTREFIEPVKREKQGGDTEVFGSILFFGPNNNGKTTITMAVAKESGCNITEIDSADDKEKTYKNIMKAAAKSKTRFEKDRKRTIIFMDEADKFINDKSPYKDEFAKFIKTCSKDYHCSVFAATNNPLQLGLDYSDPEIFPIKMSIDPADNETKKELFKFYTQGFPQEELNFDELVSYMAQKEEETGGLYSNGQIEEICNEVGLEGNEQILTTPGFIKYVKEHEFEPQISPELADKFRQDYETLIGDNSDAD